MSELKLYELTQDTMGMALDILNESLEFDRFTYSLLYEKTYGDADFEPELALIGTMDGIPIAFWMAVVRRSTGFHKLFAVRPQFRRMGIGTALLTEIEDRLRRRGVEEVRVCEGAPNYFMPGLDPRYTAALLFFQRNGYEKFDKTYNMIADLCDIEPDEKTEDQLLKKYSIMVRRASRHDREAVMEFITREFHGWEGEVSTALENDPPTIFIAELNGRVVGFSAHESNNLGTGWFGPMGTLKSMRGKGIGRVLLLRSLEDLKRLGFKQAIIPWVGPIGFYHKNCGARIDRVFWRMRKILHRKD